jgi:multidrug efflux pump subunit AcrA (membrane-fusion protein)
MRFFRRALVGLFLMALTVGLLAFAGGTVWSAMQTRLAESAGGPPVRERVFSAEVVELVTRGGDARSDRVRRDPVAADTRTARAGRRSDHRTCADAFEEGGAVSLGDVLLRIDPSDAEAALATARTDLRDAENELAEAERAHGLAIEDVAAARRQAELRARALSRQTDLLERGVGSAAAVEEAELAAATAEQAVLSRRQAEAQAAARMTDAETALERSRIALAEAERQLAETTLVAAFDGVLAEVDAAAGRLVSRNERLAQLIDDTALEVSFRISTAQYARLIGEDGTLPRAPVRVVLDVFGLDLAAEAVLTRESGSVGEGQSGRVLFARIDDARGLRVGDFVRVEVEEPPCPASRACPRRRSGPTVACWCWATRTVWRRPRSR